MSTTFQTYNGDGSNKVFTFTVPYIDSADVKARVNSAITTAFSISGSTVTFTTAPPSGSNNVKIFRDTNNATIEANFQSGSALRAVDFNDNFTQLLYVTQESTDVADTATSDADFAVTTANAAAATANTASTAAASAVSTANTASTNATASVNTANTASTNASTALSTANTASTNASTAVTTANAADTKATSALDNSRVSDGSGGFNSAISIANTASTNATNAVSTANTASTNASNAVTTANAADANATTALTNSRESDGSGGFTSAISKANTALTDAAAAQTAATNAATSATSAQTSATSAQNSATAAQTSAAASGNVADAFTATGTPATALTVDVPIDAANGVKLPTNANSYDQEGAIRYNTTLDKIEIRKGSGWGTAAGGATISSSPPSLATAGDVWYDHDNGRAYIYYNDGDSNQWVEMNPSWNGYVADNSITTAKIADDAVTAAKLANTSVTAGSYTVSSITVDAQGRITSAASGTASDADKIVEGNTQAEVVDTGSDGHFKVTTEGTERLRVDSSGKVGIGTASPSEILHVNGTASAIKIDSNGDAALRFATSGTNKFSIFHTAGGTLNFFDNANNSNRLKIDSSGNVLIGTTTLPTTDSKLTVQNGTHCEFNIIASPSHGSIINMGDSDDYNDGRIKYDNSTRSMQFQTANSERMRIDSSGNVGIGTSSPAKRLHVSGSGTQAIRLENTAASGNADLELKVHSNTFKIGLNPTANYFQDTDGKDYIWYQAGNERMRINGSGNVGININNPSAQLHVYDAGGQAVIKTDILNTASQYTYAIQGLYGGNTSFHVIANGNCANTNNSFGAISDVKLKENIVDANSQWDDIKGLRVRNYNFIEGQTHTQIGVVAQEIETVSPGLVNTLPDRDNDGNELETSTKVVNYSVLYMKAVKALQEAIDRIETLETKVNALEGA